MIGDVWLSRKECALFLTKIGYPCTSKYLENLAARRKGPPFIRRGWRSVFYHREKARAWAELMIEEVNG